MFNPTRSQRHMLPVLLATAGLFALPGACFAQAAETPASTSARPAARASGDTIRLSDAERNAILASNTTESAASMRGEQPESLRADRAIHGEVGVMIGSNGARGAYGVAEVPLGDNAGAVVSFESSRFGRMR